MFRIASMFFVIFLSPMAMASNYQWTHDNRLDALTLIDLNLTSTIITHNNTANEYWGVKERSLATLVRFDDTSGNILGEINLPYRIWGFASIKNLWLDETENALYTVSGSYIDNRLNKDELGSYSGSWIVKWNMATLTPELFINTPSDNKAVSVDNNYIYATTPCYSSGCVASLDYYDKQSGAIQGRINMDSTYTGTILGSNNLWVIGDNLYLSNDRYSQNNPPTGLLRIAMDDLGKPSIDGSYGNLIFGGALGGPVFLSDDHGFCTNHGGFLYCQGAPIATPIPSAAVLFLLGFIFFAPIRYRMNKRSGYSL